MSTIVCPTITAFEPHQYREQLERITPFAKRIHIDLMDGSFAPTHSPELERLWWPPELIVDLHLMFQEPMDVLTQLVKLKPHMVIIHNEAHVHHMHFVAELHRAGIKAGLALLQDTPVHYAEQIMPSFDHVLIFSGDLGKHGGKADLSLLKKVDEIRDLNPDIEIGWDGGISADNCQQLVNAGIQVLNVGGAIQNANNAELAFVQLQSLVIR